MPPGTKGEVWIIAHPVLRSEMATENTQPATSRATIYLTKNAVETLQSGVLARILFVAAAGIRKSGMRTQFQFCGQCTELRLYDFSQSQNAFSTS